MNKWVIGLVLAVLVLLGGAIIFMRGQTSPETTTSSTTSQSPTPVVSNDQTASNTASVTIKDFAFSPTALKVKKGTTVTWTNQDSTRHDVASTSDSPMKGLNGPLLARGQTYSFTFNEVGTYNYLCTPHASQMRASVEVVE